MSEPRPGILTLRPTQRDAVVRVWFRKPEATDYPFGPGLQSMDVQLRGAGVGGQDTLDRTLKSLLPPGCRLVRYELIA
jgi:hypothetical protein